ncbi:hypothetical protein PV08_06219 [Exophiala spinifera]|uniref:Cytochrome b561 domain-containing protein n=1 Tax=Exophiala spinifera TaxID=91928 RepID=A0A0D2BAZ7_9EURO|nr:uncharacterized protein PV08_06219 [Exophiala spinifera]KIW16168.1 hypothetical protein PV08_06219 [Exophiala spinifera]
MMHLTSLPAVLALLFACLASAYRPVQFVKHTGEAGRADQAFSLVNYYNETTQQSDLYVRMWAFRYESSALGWAALGLGPQMKGSLMFITYGDPATNELTLTVRTVDGHHPPRPVPEMADFYSGDVPVVDVVSTRFEPYDGDFVLEELQQKPSHLGIAEFIVRGYDKWTAADLGVHNDTTKQSMIWSSNFKQDYDGDFSPERNIDMHQFGLGFGFVWADLLNAVSPVPFFGPINELDGHKGVNEIGDPLEPTADELKTGDDIIAAQEGGADGGDSGNDADNDSSPTEDTPSEDTPADDTPTDGTPTDDKPPEDTPPVDTPTEDTPAEETPVPQPDGADGDTGSDVGGDGSSTEKTPVSQPGADDGTKVEEPVKTVKQWNIRSLMWHIHGFLMTLSFLILYPMAIFFLRSSRPEAFNLHWTINSLAGVGVGIGAVVGFINSRSISIPHQYAGILVVCALAVQTVLGWRHHVVYVSHRGGGGRTWMSKVHVWLGRVVLPVGMLNVVSGLLLRHYGWLTISLTLALAAVELIVLTLIVGRARRNRRSGGPLQAKSAPPIGVEEAEEYFQLGDDDDAEFSDANDEEAAGNAAALRAKKDAERQDQAKRLARLDKV